MVKTDEKSARSRSTTPTGVSIRTADTGTSRSQLPPSTNASPVLSGARLNDYSDYNQRAHNEGPLQGGEVAEKQENSDSAGLTEGLEATKDLENGNAETFG